MFYFIKTISYEIKKAIRQGKSRGIINIQYGATTEDEKINELVIVFDTLCIHIQYTYHPSV